MPAEVFGPGHRFLPPDGLLSFEAVERIVRVAVDLGVEKVRITGGEPLLRPGLETLVERLARIEGVRDLALTTNGLLLARRARSLRDAGLHRVTVSLDALDRPTLSRMAGADVDPSRILEGIEAARAAGLAPIKVNAVIRRGVNDHAIEPLARRFHDSGCTLRFIEYMDVGSCNGWRRQEVVGAAEILARIHGILPLAPVRSARRGEVARRWRYEDGGGEIGVIASVTEPFCGDCTRARLTADGKLYTCLFASRGHDLLQALQAGDDAVREALSMVWATRRDRYSELRGSLPVLPDRVEMSRVGG